MDWDAVQSICVSIAVVGAAITYIYKGIKFAKKPSDDINEKLDNDNKRLKSLEGQYRYIVSSIGVLMRSNLVILRHLQTGNESGKMSKMEQELQNFLIDQAAQEEAQVKVG